MCTKNQHDVHEKASEIQNQIGAIRDSLQIIEGNLLDFVDDYYEPSLRG